MHNEKPFYTSIDPVIGSLIPAGAVIHGNGYTMRMTDAPPFYDSDSASLAAQLYGSASGYSIPAIKKANIVIAPEMEKIMSHMPATPARLGIVIEAMIQSSLPKDALRWYDKLGLINKVVQDVRSCATAIGTEDNAMEALLLDIVMMPVTDLLKAPDPDVILASVLRSSLVSSSYAHAVKRFPVGAQMLKGPAIFLADVGLRTAIGLLKSKVSAARPKSYASLLEHLNDLRRF